MGVGKVSRPFRKWWRRKKLPVEIVGVRPACMGSQTHRRYPRIPACSASLLGQFHHRRKRLQKVAHVQRSRAAVVMPRRPASGPPRPRSPRASGTSEVLHAPCGYRAASSSRWIRKPNLSQGLHLAALFLLKKPRQLKRILAELGTKQFTFSPVTPFAKIFRNPRGLMLLPAIDDIAGDRSRRAAPSPRRPPRIRVNASPPFFADQPHDGEDWHWSRRHSEL